VAVVVVRTAGVVAVVVVALHTAHMAHRVLVHPIALKFFSQSCGRLV
jgi:hypothetical protein